MSLDAIQMTPVRAETQYPQFQAIKAQYMQQFKMLDKERQGFLRLSALEKLPAQDPNAPAIRSLFAIADRNGDDKLTEKELSDWLDWPGACTARKPG